MYFVKLQQALSLAGLHVPIAIDVHELLPILDGNPAFLLPPPCAWFEILCMYCPRFDFEKTILNIYLLNIFFLKETFINFKKNIKTRRYIIQISIHLIS